MRLEQIERLLACWHRLALQHASRSLLDDAFHERCALLKSPARSCDSRPGRSGQGPANLLGLPQAGRGDRQQAAVDGQARALSSLLPVAMGRQFPNPPRPALGTASLIPEDVVPRRCGARRISRLMTRTPSARSVLSDG